MVSRLTRVDVQQRATTAQMMDIGVEARVTAVRVRRIDEAQDRDEAALCTLQTEMAATKRELHAARAQIVESER